VTSRWVTSADSGMADSWAVIARASILTLDMKFILLYSLNYAVFIQTMEAARPRHLASTTAADREACRA
jgi:hypothetical protein